MFRLLLVAVLLACAGCWSTQAAAAGWQFGADTPDDLRELADETLETFLAAVPAQAGCVGRVGLVGARQLTDRAQYEPDDATITIRIPATAPQLRISLVHELAHHLEFSCPSQLDLRRDFLLAQGLDDGTDWREGAAWQDRPSEQWATAIVRYVLDEADPRAPVTIQPETLDLIAAWASR